MVRDGGGGAAPGQKTAAEIGVLVDRGRVGAGRHADGQRGGVRRTGVHPARRRTARPAGPGHDGAGPAGVHAGDLLPGRGAGRAPRRRGRGRPRGREPGHRGGAELVRQQAGRRGRGGQPQDVLPGVLDRRPSGDGAAGGAGRAAGAAGLILTLDWTFATGRDWGSPKIPERIDLATMVRYAPQAVVRPRWLTAYARTLRPPDLTVPNMVAAGQPPPTFFSAYAQWAATPPPT